MKEKLIEILEEFSDNVFLQGTLNPDEAYPQNFITFYVSNSKFDAFYDNDAGCIDWDVTVIYYSDDPYEVLTVPPEIIAALRDEGFIPQDAGVDILCDVKTHTGWAMNFIYPEKYEITERTK